jgi:hypothetical protein
MALPPAGGENLKREARNEARPQAWQDFAAEHLSHSSRKNRGIGRIAVLVRLSRLIFGRPLGWRGIRDSDSRNGWPDGSPNGGEIASDHPGDHVQRGRKRHVQFRRRSVCPGGHRANGVGASRWSSLSRKDRRSPPRGNRFGCAICWRRTPGRLNRAAPADRGRISWRRVLSGPRH